MVKGAYVVTMVLMLAKVGSAILGSGVHMILKKKKTKGLLEKLRSNLVQNH